jgi:hypothetical protein
MRHPRNTRVPGEPETVGFDIVICGLPRADEAGVRGMFIPPACQIGRLCPWEAR